LDSYSHHPEDGHTSGRNILVITMHKKSINQIVFVGRLIYFMHLINARNVHTHIKLMSHGIHESVNEGSHVHCIHNASKSRVRFGWSVGFRSELSDMVLLN